LLVFASVSRSNIFFHTKSTGTGDLVSSVFLNVYGMVFLVFSVNPKKMRDFLQTCLVITPLHVIKFL